MEWVLAWFSKSLVSPTHSTPNFPKIEAPIMRHHSYIETSSANNGSDRFAIATYTAHPNTKSIFFWYHRGGSVIYLTHLQFLDVKGEWAGLNITSSKGNLTIEWGFWIKRSRYSVLFPCFFRSVTWPSLIQISQTMYTCLRVVYGHFFGAVV